MPRRWEFRHILLQPTASSQNDFHEEQGRVSVAHVQPSANLGTHTCRDRLTYSSENRWGILCKIYCSTSSSSRDAGDQIWLQLDSEECRASGGSESWVWILLDQYHHAPGQSDHQPYRGAEAARGISQMLSVLLPHAKHRLDALAAQSNTDWYELRSDIHKTVWKWFVSLLRAAWLL